LNASSAVVQFRVDEYLACLTVETYAHDLRAFWTFSAERGERTRQEDRHSKSYEISGNFTHPVMDDETTAISDVALC
jgi:hypothetical protein